MKTNSMTYGIYFAYWTKEWKADYKYYIDKVSAMGFDVLEISCAAFGSQYTTDNELYELRDYAKDKGIILTAGYGPTKEQNLSSSNPSIVANAKEFFKNTLIKLNKLDVKHLGGGLYSYWPVDYSNPIDKPGDWKRSVSEVKEIASIAADNNVILGMEVLNRFEGYLLNTCAEALEFVEQVNSPNVKIMLDTFHMNIEEDNIGDAIRMAGNKLSHLHIGEQNRKVPGKGSLPWYEIGSALRDIDFSGSVVMEPFVMPGGTIGSEIKVWRNLVDDVSENSLDKDAKGALDFVKHVFTK
ncbi:sugar phosphate isomerase/epimerase [Apibacter raozihei]|uniref:D-psicose 3-epimerase n=1 Tax=Apibacter TaxID=1778601 RepID=UPI001E553A58|nr:MULTISPECIES: sugar phosphate isomerase/epimerase family protein [Apibacter]